MQVYTLYIITADHSYGRTCTSISLSLEQFKYTKAYAKHKAYVKNKATLWTLKADSERLAIFEPPSFTLLIQGFDRNFITK